MFVWLCNCFVTEMVLVTISFNSLSEIENRCNVLTNYDVLQFHNFSRPRKGPSNFQNFSRLSKLSQPCRLQLMQKPRACAPPATPHFFQRNINLKFSFSPPPSPWGQKINKIFLLHPPSFWENAVTFSSKKLSNFSCEHRIPATLRSSFRTARSRGWSRCSGLWWELYKAFLPYNRGKCILGVLVCGENCIMHSSSRTAHHRH